MFIVTAEEDPWIKMSCIVGFICYVESAQLAFTASIHSLVVLHDRSVPPVFKMNLILSAKVAMRAFPESWTFQLSGHAFAALPPTSNSFLC